MSVGNPTEYERAYFAAQAQSAWTAARWRTGFAFVRLGLYLMVVGGLALWILAESHAARIAIGFVLITHLLFRGKV